MNRAVNGGREYAGYGASGHRPATVVRLTPDDLARVRFAAGPAPLVETAMGFAELRYQARRPVPDNWASRARQVFPAAARPLRDLIPASGLWPQFLDPAVPDPDEGLEIVSATPRSRLQSELAISWRQPGHPPTWLKALADGDREALATVVGALRAFYLACVAPVWTEITAAFHDEVADQALVLARGGLGELFDSLHPDLTLRNGALERSERALARAGRPGQIQLDGQGLQILPSMLWTGPPLFSTGLAGSFVSTMIYSAQRGFRAGTHSSPRDLGAVLGRTRASALRALRDSCSTTELAARLSISVSSASQHATALRVAGLIRTERHGSAVQHSLTAVGHSLLGGPPDADG